VSSCCGSSGSWVGAKSGSGVGSPYRDVDQLNSDLLISHFFWMILDVLERCKS